MLNLCLYRFHTSQRLFRLTRCGAAVERIQHTDRLQADLLVGAVLVLHATARRDEVLHRLGPVARLRGVLHQEALRDVARAVVSPELQPAGARVLVFAAVHEHALGAEHLDVEVLARRLIAVLVARPAAATREADAAALGAADQRGVRQVGARLLRAVRHRCHLLDAQPSDEQHPP
eukprot:scaffold1885_cov63-Phaeocystis_antarctica.AAC.3